MILVWVPDVFANVVQWSYVQHWNSNYKSELFLNVEYYNISISLLQFLSFSYLRSASWQLMTQNSSDSKIGKTFQITYSALSNCPLRLLSYWHMKMLKYHQNELMSLWFEELGEHLISIILTHTSLHHFLTHLSQKNEQFMKSLFKAVMLHMS